MYYYFVMKINPIHEHSFNNARAISISHVCYSLCRGGVRGAVDLPHSARGVIL